MKRKHKIKVDVSKLPEAIYRETLRQGMAEVALYTVVAFSVMEGRITFECYGPFKGRKEAQRQADAIEYPCLKFIELLWGNVAPQRNKK